MKKISAVVLAVASAACACAATVDQVIVRQQWPWSTDVKVEYRLSGVTSPVDISVALYNGDTLIDTPNLYAAIWGDLYGVSDGAGTFYIDPTKVFGEDRVAISDFRVVLSLSASPANLDEVLYKIFCLTNDTCKEVRRRDILNGKFGSYETDFGKIGSGYNTTLNDVLIWTGVTNDVAYKTTHIVMRKVPAANVEWKMGSPANELYRESDSGNYAFGETQHLVKVTHDYFIGVFEVTQAQYKHIKDANPSYFADLEDSPLHPVEQVGYGTMRGKRDESANGEKICWPTNSNKHAVYSNSICGKLRSKFSVEFDLPTEAMWEFACRAGTTNSLYIGKEVTSALVNDLAWNSANSKLKSGTSARYTSAVGLKRPNALGLYDMYGNVSEKCLDWAVRQTPVNEGDGPLVDPDGVTEPNSINGRQVRGSNATYDFKGCRSAYRVCGTFWADTATSYLFGFRLACPVGSTWE